MSKVLLDADFPLKITLFLTSTDWGFLMLYFANWTSLNSYQLKYGVKIQCDWTKGL